MAIMVRRLEIHAKIVARCLTPVAPNGVLSVCLVSADAEITPVGGQEYKANSTDLHTPASGVGLARF